MGIPSYYVWKLFGANRGKMVVASELTQEKTNWPFHGGVAIMGSAKTLFRNVLLDGDRAVALHEFPYENKDHGQTLSEGNAENFCRIYGSEEMTQYTFEAEIAAAAGKPVEVGLFCGRIPRDIFNIDESAEQTDWMMYDIKPLRWMIDPVKGSSSFVQSQYPEDIVLSVREGLPTDQGEPEYHHYAVQTDGEAITLCIDGQEIHKVHVPTYRSLGTVVTDTDKEVIIKLVNMENTAKDIDIHLDRAVKSSYQVSCVDGDPQAANTFTEPEKVSIRTWTGSGAAKDFTYQAPASSVQVLTLTKC